MNERKLNLKTFRLSSFEKFYVWIMCRKACSARRYFVNRSILKCIHPCSVSACTSFYNVISFSLFGIDRLFKSITPVAFYLTVTAQVIAYISYFPKTMKAALVNVCIVFGSEAVSCGRLCLIHHDNDISGLNDQG